MTDTAGPEQVSAAPPERATGTALAARNSDRRSLAVLPGECLIVPFADDPGRIDASRFAFLLGVLELMGRPLVAILPAAARNIAAAYSFVNAASLSLRLHVAEGPLYPLYGLADIALIDLALTPGDRVIEHAGTRAVLSAWLDACGCQLRGDTEQQAQTRPVPELPPTLRWASSSGAPAQPSS